MYYIVFYFSYCIVLCCNALYCIVLCVVFVSIRALASSGRKVALMIATASVVASLRQYHYGHWHECADGGRGSGAGEGEGSGRQLERGSTSS